MPREAFLTQCLISGTCMWRSDCVPDASEHIHKRESKNPNT